MSLRGSPIRRLEMFSKQSSSEVLALTAEVERLSSMMHSKNLQIKDLYDENRMLKLQYEQQITGYKNTIRVLEERLKDTQIARAAEFGVIKQKYDQLAVEESQNMKSYHSHQVEFLLKEIAHLRVDCASKDETLNVKNKQIASLSESYERQIEQKINEINTLTKTLLSLQDTKNREIKQINSKRQLQKSRTSGVLSSRKQNNQFMDKQIRKLNEQILEKAIKIENLTREINKSKRKFEEGERLLNKKIQDLTIEREEESRQREEYFAKVEKSLKQQILEFKSSELKYLSQIDSLKSVTEVFKSDLNRYENTVKSKQEEINSYKELLNKQREDHAKEIANLMKQRRKRSSNLGSSRSLSSSLKDAGNSEEHAPSSQANALKRMDSIRLATVKEESPDKSLNRSMENSHLTEEVGQQENEMVKLIYHYDTLIQELKRSHAGEVQLLRHKLNKLTKSLDEKQQELLDMLTRFSPLVKIHAQQKSVQEDRKERIERHWKADLALLEIMLNKYKIKAYG